MTMHKRAARPRPERTTRDRLADTTGLALIATILVLALVAVLTVTALTGAMSSTRISGSDYEDTRVFYAAEAGGEATLAQLSVALKDGYLSDDELASIEAPKLDAINFDSFAVKKVGGTYVETITDGPYAGLYALTQDVDIYARAANSKGDMSAVILRSKAQAIPVFQFGVFFDEDLEATNGPPMEFAGRVHSNGNIYLSSNNAWYREMVTTPQKIFHDRKDHHRVLNGVYIDDAAGNEVPLDFDSRTHPDPEAFKAASCAEFDCRLQTDAFGVDSLQMPLPDGVPMIEVVRPREDTDSESEREVKFAWNADMYVTVNLQSLSTKGAVCGTASPIADPDVNNGSNITVIGVGELCPKGTVAFTASHPALTCSDFDSRATLTIDADAWVTSGPMSGCTFSVTLPSGNRDFKIKIELKKEDYPQLSVDGLADLVWLKESIANQCPGLADDTPWPQITIVRSGGRQSPSATDMCRIFQWEWSDFYDGRETKIKDVLNVDIGELTAWVGGLSGRASDVMYIEFLPPTDAGNYKPVTKDMLIDGTVDAAVRMTNGAALPNPFTIATEWPLYVRGNYNSVNKQPTALVGDAINILSNSWSDVANRPDQATFDKCNGLFTLGNPCSHFTSWAGGWSKKTATETTVNAAILAGHWPTPCDHEEPSCPADGSTSYYTDWYGGGLENYPRFLESWSGVPLHYRGALISPFTSQKTTGTWNGTYYSPPIRDWAFDTDFRNPELLPPGTPNVGYVIRTAMREVF